MRALMICLIYPHSRALGHCAYVSALRALGRDAYHIRQVARARVTTITYSLDLLEYSYCVLLKFYIDKLNILLEYIDFQ